MDTGSESERGRQAGREGCGGKGGREREKEEGRQDGKVKMGRSLSGCLCGEK